MRDHAKEIEAAGGAIVAIGMGTPHQARDAAERMQITFPLLVDGARATYRAAALERGGADDVMGPRTWGPALKSLSRGRGLGVPQQDPFQLGGTLVLSPGDEILMIHRSRHSADNVSVAEILRALARAPSLGDQP